MAENKRGIPEIRNRLREIADDLEYEELHGLADEICLLCGANHHMQSNGLWHKLQG